VIGLSGGNKTRAAKILGVARETLRIRLTARQSSA
jgi:DNA-binding protein Fis